MVSLPQSSRFPLSIPPCHRFLPFLIGLFGSPYLHPQFKRSFAKIAWNRGPTLDITHTFYPHFAMLPNSCPPCLSAAESNGHLFLHCPISWRLWGNLLQLVNLVSLPQLHWLIYYLLRGCSYPAGVQGNCSSCVCLPLCGRYRRSEIVVYLEIILETPPQFGMLSNFILLVGLKIYCNLSSFSFESLHCNLRSIFSSLMWTILLLYSNEIFFFLLIKKNIDIVGWVVS